MSAAASLLKKLLFELLEMFVFQQRPQSMLWLEIVGLNESSEADENPQDNEREKIVRDSTVDAFVHHSADDLRRDSTTADSVVSAVSITLSACLLTSSSPDSFRCHQNPSSLLDCLSSSSIGSL